MGKGHSFPKKPIAATLFWVIECSSKAIVETYLGYYGSAMSCFTVLQYLW